MIGSPARITQNRASPPSAPAGQSPATNDPAPGQPTPDPATGAQGPPSDDASGTQGAPTDAVDGDLLAARIAALVARATTPQDEALERQREQFDFVTKIQAECDREINALRDIAMEQMKQDDELLKKWIALI